MKTGKIPTNQNAMKNTKDGHRTSITNEQNAPQRGVTENN